MSGHPAENSGPDAKTPAGAFNDAARRSPVNLQEFTTRYQSRVAQLSPAEFLEACRAYETLAAAPDTPDFFTREIAGLDESALLEKMAAPGMAHYAPFLAALRRSKDHHLSAAAETYQANMREVGADAWHRLYDMHRAAGAPEKSYALVLNTLLQLEEIDDAARGFEAPGDKMRHALRLSPAQTALMDKAAKASLGGTTQKFAALKRPAAAGESHFTAAQAAAILRQGLTVFSPALAAQAEALFPQGPAADAFSPQDILSAARRLGAEIQTDMAKAQGPLYQVPPALLRETLSIFAEVLVLEALLPQLTDPLEQAGLMAHVTEKWLGDMQHPAMLSAFERRIHAERREKGELGAPRLGALWQESCRQETGSVAAPDGWTREETIFKTPHASLAAAAAGVTGHSLVAAWRAAPDKAVFAERLMQGLEAGGAANPHVVLAALGCNADAPAFWKQGFAEAGRYIDEMAKRLPAARVAAANDDAKTPVPKRKNKAHKFGGDVP